MNKPRVLIVEDEADIRRFVKLSLEQEGMAVFEASTAKEALVGAATRKPDLVIVDLGLPDSDGKAFIKELRGWSAAPVVVLSAREDEAEKVAALDAGADDYHIGFTSFAKDNGIDAGVSVDFEGDHRPSGPGCDIGFDERNLTIFLPLVVR